MPSPIAHLAAGYVIYKFAQYNVPRPPPPLINGVPTLLLVAGAFTMLPDADSVVGVLAGDFGRYHNNASHSLIVGVIIALVFAAIMKWRANSFRFWFLFATACYSLHVLMDASTLSRGVMAFWPVTGQRFLSPITIFYGVRWSEGIISANHLWTLGTELIFAALVMLPWQVWPRRGQGDT